MEYPVPNGCVRRFAIGFIVNGTTPAHDLEHLTRVVEQAPFDNPVRFCMVEDGSTADLPRLKTREIARKPAKDGRRLSYELHVLVDEKVSAEETFQRVSATLAKHGWEADGGPA